MDNLVADVEQREQAYAKGWDAQARPTNDWDEAAARFARRYCPPHPRDLFCELEHAWSDGWSDRQASRAKWHALRCPQPGHDHELCTDDQ